MTEEDEVATILNAAADLITPEGAWTKDTFARDSNGKAIFYESPHARSWCVKGAIRKAARNKPIELHWQALAEISQLVKIEPLSRWNDAQTSSEPVIAALRAAAANAYEA